MDKLLEIPLENVSKMMLLIISTSDKEVMSRLLSMEDDIMKRGVDNSKVKLTLKEYNYLKEQYENVI